MADEPKILTEGIPNEGKPINEEEETDGKPELLSAWDVTMPFPKVLPDLSEDALKLLPDNHMGGEHQLLLSRRDKLFHNVSRAHQSTFGTPAYIEFEKYQNDVSRTLVKDFRLLEATYRPDVDQKSTEFFRDNYLAKHAALSHVPFDAMFRVDGSGQLTDVYKWPVPSGLGSSQTGDLTSSGIEHWSPDSFPVLGEDGSIHSGKLTKDNLYFRDYGDYKRKVGLFTNLYEGLRNQNTDMIWRIYNKTEGLPTLPPEAVPKVPRVTLFRNGEDITGLPRKEGDIALGELTTKGLDIENWKQEPMKGYAFLLAGIIADPPPEEAPAETEAMAFWKNTDTPDMGNYNNFKANMVDQIIIARWNVMSDEDKMTLRKLGGLAGRFSNGAIKVDGHGLAAEKWGTGNEDTNGTLAATKFFDNQLAIIKKRFPDNYNAPESGDTNPLDVQSHFDSELDRLVDAISLSCQKLMPEDGPKVEGDIRFKHPIMAALSTVASWDAARSVSRASDEELQMIADLAVQYVTLQNLSSLRGDKYEPFAQRRSASYSSGGDKRYYTFQENIQIKGLLDPIKAAADFSARAEGRIFPLAEIIGLAKPKTMFPYNNPALTSLSAFAIKDQASGRVMGSAPLQTVHGKGIPNVDITGSVSAKADFDKDDNPNERLHDQTAQEQAAFAANPQLDKNDDGLVDSAEIASARQERKPKPVSASKAARVSLRQPLPKLMEKR